MTFDTFKMTSLTGLILTVPALAFAGVTLGDTLGTTQEDIRAHMSGLGYEVLEIEIEGDEIEVEYRFEGVEYEAELDPKSGQVIALEIEEADDHDDDS